MLTGDVAAVEREIQRAFTPTMIDELRRSTGYNARLRIATAYRVVLTVVEASLLGETLSFCQTGRSAATWRASRAAEERTSTSMCFGVAAKTWWR